MAKTITTVPTGSLPVTMVNKYARNNTNVGVQVCSPGRCPACAGSALIAVMDSAPACGTQYARKWPAITAQLASFLSPR